MLRPLRFLSLLPLLPSAPRYAPGLAHPALAVRQHLGFATASSTQDKKRSMSGGPPASASGIDLYTFPTPNGVKLTIALEELKAAGVPVTWKEYKIDFSKNEQKEPWFLAINPNGRIPAMVDHDRKDTKVWESASMLLYIAKHYDTGYVLHFEDEDLEQQLLNWVFFQHGGLGPMQGQAGHFVGAAPEKIAYGAKRYIEETKRLYSVYEDRLSEDGGRDYLVGEGKGKYSYADIVTVGWVRASPMIGLPSLAEAGFPKLQAWLERIEARPAVKKGLGENNFVDKMKAEEGWEAKSKARTAFAYPELAERKKVEL